MGESLLTRIRTWLRAGYPSGVPQQDYLALLGLLHRQLTVTEMDEIVAALIEQADGSAHPIDRAEIEQMVRLKTYQDATEEDIARVAAHLTSGGAPLTTAHDPAGDDDAESPKPDESDAGPTDSPTSAAAGPKENLLARVVAWLKDGYPTGVPQQDYVPIMAILRRRLGDDEVPEVVELLTADGTLPADRAEIGVAITKITEELPTEADFARVREHLDESDLDNPR